MMDEWDIQKNTVGREENWRLRRMVDSCNGAGCGGRHRRWSRMIGRRFASWWGGFGETEKTDPGILSRRVKDYHDCVPRVEIDCESYVTRRRRSRVESIGQVLLREQEDGCCFACIIGGRIIRSGMVFFTPLSFPDHFIIYDSNIGEEGHVLTKLLS